MPGRRNLQRERHQHRAPAIQHAIYTSLHTQLPALDRALVGQSAILGYLHALGIRRRRGTVLTWRIVNRWRTHHGCPILRGHKTLHVSSSPLSTSHALTAWVLSRFTSCDLFNVVASTHTVTPAGSFTASRKAA